MKQKLRQIAGRLIVVGFGVGLGLLLCELILSFLPGIWAVDSYHHKFDPTVGYWPEASQNTRYGSGCFEISSIHTNAFGMRDRERDIEKSNYRVAFLGDSMLEAIQVEDHQVFNRLLEQKFPEIEFLNFGVSGFGPGQELVAYREKVRPFKPDVVIVSLWLLNDLSDSSLEFRRALFSESSKYSRVPLFSLSDSGDLILTPPPSNPIERKTLFKEVTQDALISLLPRTYRFSVLGRIHFEQWLVSHADRAGSGEAEKTTEVSADVNSSVRSKYSANFLYSPPSTRVWRDAWALTEKILLRFREEVEQDGSQFVVVNLPINTRQALMSRHQFVSEMGYEDELIKDVDPLYPYRRLEEFVDRENIQYLSLVPGFMEFVRENHLEEPYFSFTCDGHWNPLGHRLASELLGEFLSKSELVPSQSK